VNYKNTLDWLFEQLPMYQRKGALAYKKDVSNITLLAQYLNHPQRKFKSIHVGGTNGKGSTCHMLASILQEAGYKVGLYTSPHLKDFRERIRINGKVISKKKVIGFIKRNKPFFEANDLSFFEMSVGMAFDVFAKQNVDIAIIEVGLGGRLDSTNIITPEVSVITNIGLDHVQILGSTLEAIAKEKAGIIKPLVPVVIGETHALTKTVFQEIAQEKKAKISFADQQEEVSYKTDLLGEYQKKNTKTTSQVIKEIRLKGFNISQENIKNGFSNVVKNTGLLGRWQIIKESPKVICDTAHNKEGLLLVLKQLENEKFESLHIVFGVVVDKNINTILDLLPKKATYYLCKPNIYRGMEVNKLKAAFEVKKIKSKSYGSVREAYISALAEMNNTDLMFVGGSTFVVAEVLTSLK